MSDLTGKQLEQYYLDRSLGRGVSSTVYLARHLQTGQPWAVKVLIKAHAANAAKQFLEGARLAAGLQHPNIVRIQRVGEDQGYSFVAMEYLGGGTLEALLRGQLWRWEQAEPVLRQVASALDHAHARGVVHRDVKPSNILFSADRKHVALSDFGIAQSLFRQQPAAQPDRAGTLIYMSPEQCRGRPVGPSTDIYALAVVAYQMLVGRLPFNAEEPLALVHQHISQPPPRPRSTNPSLPPHVEKALLRGLAKSPAKRFRSAAQLVDALAGRPSKQVSQRRRLAVVFTVGVLLIATVLGLWAWQELAKSPTPSSEATVSARATLASTVAPTTRPASTLMPTVRATATSAPTRSPQAPTPTSAIRSTSAARVALSPTATALLPVASCRRPQIAQITSPRQGQVITGEVTVTGTAGGSTFDRYEFFYKRSDEAIFHQYLGKQWRTPVVDGVLGSWNPDSPNLRLPADEYQLLLRVVNRSSNYDDCIVTIFVR